MEGPMVLTITPEVFVDLMRLCLTWEWEKAKDRAKASHNRENPLYATQLGWTTVDKIVRILHGLEIVTKKQRSMFYKDRRLQYLVLRNTEAAAIGDPLLSRVLQDSKKDFVLQCEMAESINREKMLRNTRFYITTRGQTVARLVSGKYATSITKERYFSEIERQNDLLPRGPGSMETIVTNYRQKVEEETS